MPGKTLPAWSHVTTSDERGIRPVACEYEYNWATLPLGGHTGVGLDVAKHKEVKWVRSDRTF
jgi:hypothetical protein